MITKNTPAEISYTGNDTANTFAIPFPSWNATDIEVLVNRLSDGISLDLTHEVDFSLSDDRKSLTLIDSSQEWLDSGGNLATGYVIYIRFTDEAAQLSKFTDLGRTAPMQFEGSLDRIAMTVKSVRDVASRALSIGGGSGVDTNLPPLQGNADRILKVKSDESGFDYGPDVQEIFDARDDAVNAAQAAEGFKDTAVQASSDAESARDDAEQSALDAQGFANDAQNSAIAAGISEGNAATSEQRAELWANYYAWSNVKTITFAESPYTVDYEVDEDTMIMVDSSGGLVEINLPNLSEMPNSDWKVGVALREASNGLTVTPYPGQNINGQSSLTLLDTDMGVAFHDTTPTNWRGAYLVMGSFGDSSASPGLPPGGDEGYALEKQSNVDGDAAWVSMTYQGFSQKHNQEVNLVGLKAVTDFLIGIAYAAPTVSLSASGSSSVYEKGYNINSVDLSANVTKRSDPIARIRFLLDGVAFEDMNPPSNTGSGVTAITWNGTINDTSVFRVEVTDNGDTGGPTTVGANVTFNFVYPYYYGTGAPGLTAAAVAGLTKNVIASNANLTRSFTTSAGQVYYFAYPSSYGALTSILDQNNFETISSWNMRQENITGLNGTPVLYRIYEFTLPQAAGTMDFTFKR